MSICSVLQLKLAIDYLAYTLIVEAQAEAQNKAGAQNMLHNPPTAVSDGM